MKFLKWWWKEYDVKDAIMFFTVASIFVGIPFAIFWGLTILEYHFIGTRILMALFVIAIYGGVFWVFIIDPIKGVTKRWQKRNDE